MAVEPRTARAGGASGRAPRHPGNLADPLRLAAERFGDLEMVAYGSHRYSYGEFNERVNRLAGGLLALGLRPGDTVVSVSHNSDSVLALYFALAKVGAVSVPLSTMLTAADIGSVLERSRSRLFVFGSEFCELADEVTVEAPERILVDREHCPGERLERSLADLEADGPPGEPPAIEGGPNRATVIFTSGSTGRPKGCVKSHANQIWSAVNCQLSTPRRRGGVELYAIPLAGIGFANFILPSVMAGARIVLCGFEPRRCLELIERERVTHGFFAGTMLDAMLRVDDQEQFDLSSLEVLETAYQLSERLRSEIANRFGLIVRYCYGSSEGTNWAAPASVFRSRPDCVGFPKGLDDFRVVDDRGETLPPGEIGEVMVGGPTVMLEYFDDPEATAKVLRGGWLLTGDLGETAEDGMLLFRGRKKDIIKSGGMNVPAGEVELALVRHPGILEAAVIGVPDEHWGEAVRAVVVADDQAPPGDELCEQLREHCRAELASFKRPKDYVVAESLPKNPGGKVAKGRVREIFGDHGD